MSQSLPSKMQAWKVHVGKPEPILEEVDVPKPGDGEMLVKILAAGVCHSDCTLLGMKEAPPGMNMRPQYTLGHEGAGEVVQLGQNVKDFKVGDKVAMLIIPGCEESSCPVCSTGLQRLCHGNKSGNYGLGISDGFFAEYVNVMARAAVKVPDSVNMPIAAVAPDAVLTAYHAIRYTADVQPHQTIAIYGLGGLGLNAVQIAQHLGVKRILVVDKRQETVDLAVGLGVAKEDAFCTGNSGSPSIEQYAAEKGVNIDTTIDFVGHGDTFQSAQFAVRAGGTMVQVGLISPTVTMIPLVTVLKGVTIKCHYNGSMEALRECMDLLAKGVIKPSVETGSMKTLPKVVKDLDEGKIKSRMVLVPDWTKA
ncbi:hypothetical protein LTR86_005210 [Recurvomyces mirabilis]|nr:hypothetical protein LTR86_005210 [Recurvomyces mirabilis]